MQHISRIDKSCTKTKIDYLLAHGHISLRIRMLNQFVYTNANGRDKISELDCCANISLTYNVLPIKAFLLAEKNKAKGIIKIRIKLL